MATLLRMSEATVLGLHAAVLVAEADHPMSASEIAARLHASEAHLAKVLLTLARARLLRSKRGPKGGYMLTKPASEITLLDVYEALEGTLPLEGCLFDRTECDRAQCILGGLVKSVRQQIAGFFDSTTLETAAETGIPLS